LGDVLRGAAPAALSLHLESMERSESSGLLVASRRFFFALLACRRSSGDSLILLRRPGTYSAGATLSLVKGVTVAVDEPLDVVI
jgi:hypothetical protein